VARIVLALAAQDALFMSNIFVDVLRLVEEGLEKKNNQNKQQMYRQEPWKNLETYTDLSTMDTLILLLLMLLLLLLLLLPPPLLLLLLPLLLQFNSHRQIPHGVVLHVCGAHVLDVFWRVEKDPTGCAVEGRRVSEPAGTNIRREEEEEGLHYCVLAATLQRTPGLSKSCEQLSSHCHP
jgi:hypothetical protein